MFLHQRIEVLIGLLQRASIVWSAKQAANAGVAHRGLLLRAERVHGAHQNFERIARNHFMSFVRQAAVTLRPSAWDRCRTKYPPGDYGRVTENARRGQSFGFIGNFLLLQGVCNVPRTVSPSLFTPHGDNKPEGDAEMVSAAARSNMPRPLSRIVRFGH
jgi:hypothetical protein